MEKFVITGLLPPEFPSANGANENPKSPPAQKERESSGQTPCDGNYINTIPPEVFSRLPVKNEPLLELERWPFSRLGGEKNTGYIH